MDIMAVYDQVDPDLSEKVWTIVVRTCIYMLCIYMCICICIYICICICIVIIIVCFKSPLLIPIVHLKSHTTLCSNSHTHAHTRRTIHADGSTGIYTIVRTRYESGTE